MSLDSSIQLGRILGRANNEQEVSIKDNLSPIEADALFSVWNSESIKIEGTLTISKKLYATNQLILDHPVYGFLDNPDLKMDMPYADEEVIQVINY